MPTLAVLSAGGRGRGSDRSWADVHRHSVMAWRGPWGRKGGKVGTLANSSDFGVRPELESWLYTIA